MGLFKAILDNALGWPALQKAVLNKWKPEPLAQQWVSDNGNRLEGFKGTKAALDQRINDTVNDCGAYVHEKNWQISTKTAKSVCRNQIEQKYATQIANYTSAQALEEAKVKEAVMKNNSALVAVVAIILIVLITVVIILKIKNK